MVKLKLCERFSRNFFFKASGLALITAITMFSCNDESPIVENNETNDYLLDEYAFFDPSDTLNITVCEAEDIATAFMDELGGIDNTFKSKGLRYSCRKTTVIPDENREPALYAINLDPDGFCIVAATKKTESILAYCDQGKFDFNNLPEGLAEWMIEKIEIIQETRGEASISTFNPNIPPKDSGMLPNGKREADDQYIIDTYGPLLKTEWDQFSPYNYVSKLWNK
ncbi:MAG: Spi family protease inhibitor [Salinivirgaceae bacterium]|nr:Spi family protease inhibitor [Salinivirgaceae bacterium]